jgi:hypothetical protein
VPSSKLSDHNQAGKPRHNPSRANIINAEPRAIRILIILTWRNCKRYDDSQVCSTITQRITQRSHVVSGYHTEIFCEQVSHEVVHDFCLASDNVFLRDVPKDGFMNIASCGRARAHTCELGVLPVTSIKEITALLQGFFYKVSFTRFTVAYSICAATQRLLDSA